MVAQCLFPSAWPDQGTAGQRGDGGVVIRRDSRLACASAAAAEYEDAGHAGHRAGAHWWRGFRSGLCDGSG